MIEELRGNSLNKEEISNGEYELVKNTPRLIDNKSNNCEGVIEEKNGEKIRIASVFNDNSFALISHEYKLNYYDSSKATDFFYMYFGENRRLIFYLYDLKETLAGVNNITHLVEQWLAGISTARSCELLLKGNKEDYELKFEDIHIGVITENNDSERRKNKIEYLKKQIEDPKVEMPSFIIGKHKAKIVQDNAILNVLQEFETGYIEFDGIKYKYDIREFIDKEHRMTIVNGLLESN